jgi:hypothetical protein
MKNPTAKCQRHDCHNTIAQPQNGRRKRFCSDACRKALGRVRTTVTFGAQNARIAKDTDPPFPDVFLQVSQGLARHKMTIFRERAFRGLAPGMASTRPRTS